MIIYIRQYIYRGREGDREEEEEWRGGEEGRKREAGERREKELDQGTSYILKC